MHFHILGTHLSAGEKTKSKKKILWQICPYFEHARNHFSDKFIPLCHDYFINGDGCIYPCIYKKNPKSLKPCYDYASAWLIEKQKHQFGVLFQTIYQKGTVLKLFTKRVYIYLHCAKDRGAIQRGADMWYSVVVPKALRNGLLQLQWHNHFWSSA